MPFTVFFGAPGQQPDHAARAIARALALDVSANLYATALRNETEVSVHD
jgi:hypothetical protein